MRRAHHKNVNIQPGTEIGTLCSGARFGKLRIERFEQVVYVNVLDLPAEGFKFYLKASKHERDTSVQVSTSESKSEAHQKAKASSLMLT